MSATILFWRHGQTEYNAAGRLQGQIDIPLDEVGHAQAQAAAPVLAQIPPVAIVSSDLQRARGTAEYLAEVTGLEVRTDERLRERSFGAWEGLTHADLARDWPEQYARWSRGENPDGVGAEDRRVTGQRVAQAAMQVAAQYALGEVVVLVSHGTAIGAGASLLLGQDAEEWHGLSGIGNCHWSVLQPGARAPGWRLTAYNCGGGLTDFPRGARII